jgi:hypothetical protein
MRFLVVIGVRVIVLAEIAFGMLVSVAGVRAVLMGVGMFVRVVVLMHVPVLVRVPSAVLVGVGMIVLVRMFVLVLVGVLVVSLHRSLLLVMTTSDVHSGTVPCAAG